jgi:penicillin amidase
MKPASRACVTALAAVVGVAAAVMPAPARTRAVSVVPLGQSGVPGNVHAADQLPLERGFLFKASPLRAPAGAPAQVVTAGAIVRRDSFGVPYVRGSNLALVAFGAGYAEAADRFYEMDVLRRQVEGRTAEIVPASTQGDEVSADAAARAYDATDASLLAQLAHRPLAERRALKAFANGVNAWLAHAAATSTLPPEYAALGQPAPWRIVDSLQIAYGFAHSFAAAGGDELRNARLLSVLRARFRARLGDAYFADLLWRSDPAAPVTAGGTGLSTTRALGGYGGLTAKGAVLPVGDPQPALPVTSGAGPFLSGDLHQPSLAIAVGRGRALGARALVAGGPRLGQFAPGAVMEIGLEGGGVVARGATIPGIGPFVIWGHSPTHAFTFTSGESDQEDTFADVVRVDGLYQWNGSGHAFTTRTETILARNAGGALVPAKTVQIRTDVHGRVVATGKIRTAGRTFDVAFARKAMFAGHELSMFGTFLRLDQAVGLRAIRRVLPSFAPGLDLVYGDTAGHVGYWHLGVFRERSVATDDRLPALGTGRFDWGPRLPFSRNPQAVDPRGGVVASADNKPQTDWVNGDEAPWGVAGSVRLLQDELARPGRISLVRLQSIMRRTATADGRLKLFGPIILDAVANALDTPTQQAADQLANWDGSRRDADGDGRIDAPAAAIMDEWWLAAKRRLVRARIGAAALAASGQAASDPTYFGSDGASLLLHVLRGPASSVPLRGTWGKPAFVRRQVALALGDAVRILRARYHTADVQQWLGPAPGMGIVSLSPLLTPPALAFANRGSFDELVAVS